MEEEESDCIVDDLLRNPFYSRNFTCKKEIIDNGRPTPNLSNIVSETRNKVRRFNVSWYTSEPWVCGCKHSSSLYCWPCLLFSTEKNVWTTKGISDINSYYVLKKRHELSVTHVNCKIALQKFGNIRIDESLSLALKINQEKYNESVKGNRYIVGCLIDTVCFLVEQELSFRDHVDDSESTNKGNYVELLHHRASYDEKLRIHMESSNVFVGTSHDIQTDVIESIFTVMMNKIKDEVAEATFVSVIEGEATDINQKSQLSFVLRYVTVEGVQERFIRFKDICEDDSAVSLAVHVFDLMNEFKCGEKLVTQTYDGCFVLAGVHDELQKFISDKYETALFVHCYAHKLNLVLKQSVDCINGCKVFFETLSGFAAFFSRSPKLKAAFDTLIANRLPSVASTRWIYAEKLVEVISEVKVDLITFFEAVMNNPEEWDGETRISSKGYYATLQDFDFNFLLNLFSTVLPEAKILFNILQSKVSDIRFCSEKVQEFKLFLTYNRENFDTFWKRVKDEHSLLKPYEDEVQAKRQRSANVNNDKKTPYHRLYCIILDTMTEHLTNRFSEIHKLGFLALLDFDNFEAYSETFPKKAYESLIESYGRYFNSLILKTELSAIYASSEFQKSSILELYKYLTRSGLDSALPEVTKLCTLFLTVPSTSTSVERRFSVMNRIHSYLRSTHAQEKLAKLPFISIEKNILRSMRKSPMFYDLVIDSLDAINPDLELIYKL